MAPTPIHLLIALLALLFLVSPAAAIPDTIHLQSDTEWLTAGSSAYATITATISNGTTPLPAIPVTFSLDDPTMGSLSSASTSTTGEGKATVRFTPATQSGDAVIRVSAGYDSKESAILQKIDHAEPANITDPVYQHEATVGSRAEISVGMRDAYGNPVDNRREAALGISPESIALTVTSAGGNAGFLTPEGNKTTITVPVDDRGAITASLQLDTYPGDHIISIDPSPDGIATRWITINAIADAVPHDLSYVVTPVTGTAPADGEAMFTIRYYFTDEYGNPAGAQAINYRITGPAETQEDTFTTSSLGEIVLTYGPVLTTGTYEITCSPADNPALQKTLPLTFHSSEPVAMLLTANPLMIASRDAKPDTRADIRAKVIDKRGHPVAGEEVTFTVLPGATEGYLHDPKLHVVNAVTNEYGFATASFYPGDFTQDWTCDSFNPRAAGEATIHAEWMDKEDEVTIIWKNYPFLSISTMIEPETVRVNETINVTMQISGDGWFLQSGSRVDVVQVIDSSGSMSAGDIEPNRLDAAQSVTHEFADMIMDLAGNRVAIFSSANTITLEQELTYEKTLINQAIERLSSGGSGRLMRAGCYQAIHHLEFTSRPGVVKAVILLGDMNSWNPKGNHLGDEYHFDNLLAYANEHDVRIYTVMLAADESSNTYQLSANFSEATGGRAFNAQNYMDLMEAYLQITEELSYEAGVNTTIDLSHENVKVNQADHPGGDVFEYVPQTVITNRYYNGTVTRTELDQTDDWRGITPPAANAPAHSLFFDIGTIYLGQVWEARYQLRVLQEGTIELFDPRSAVSFEDAPEDGQQLQTVYINALPGIEEIKLQDLPLRINNLRSTASQSVTDILPITWEITYGGDDDATQHIQYTIVDPIVFQRFNYAGPYDWQTATTLTTPGPVVGQKMTRDINVADRHGVCLIRIRASAPGTPDDTAWMHVPVGRASAESFIKIE
ncbi:MAG: VWA domain-containing protein [Methanocalculus sp. MSAO_Arc1]|uniref:VWA domain-containing protein n=1 Tax=Methanocalculus TaxID=71151 RepID=UPI000FF0E959|nr:MULTISPECIES: VWA domain-containing protein [unclassified Methanocalculus]MCP1662970.1 hypothetical protein [Methanocalculus sp. AMF5]RQD80741.1 MAG: VWA domain-containing protein [Methanocalculus sp. MSAO_Arc1]